MEEFFKACKGGDITKINEMIAAGVDVNTLDRYGKTPLHAAAKNGDKDAVEALLVGGADPNIARTDNGTTPLWIAAQKGHEVVVKALIEADGIEVNKAETAYGQTPLYTASYSGHTETVAALLAAGADLNLARTDNGVTPLYSASYSGHTETVAALLAAGADLNLARTDNGQTPLYSASYSGHTKVVAALIAEGADPNLAALNGQTPLHAAAKNGDKDAVEALLVGGADPNIARTFDDSTPLYMAAAGGHAQTVAALIAAEGVDVNKAETAYGRTPLYIAAAGGHSDVVNILLAAGADPNIASPSDIWLLQGGTIVNVQNTANKTPLFVATTPEITRTLLNAGAIPIAPMGRLIAIDPAILQGLDNEFGVFVASLYYTELVPHNQIGTDAARARLTILTDSLQVDEDESLPNTPNYAKNPERFFTVKAQRAYQAVMADDSIAHHQHEQQATQAALLTYFTLQRNAEQLYYVSEESLQPVMPKVKALMLSIARSNQTSCEIESEATGSAQEETTIPYLPPELILLLARQILTNEAFAAKLASPEFARAKGFVESLPVDNNVKKVVMDLQTSALPSMIDIKAIVQVTTFPKEMRQLMSDPRTTIRYSNDELEMLVQRWAEQNADFLSKLQGEFPVATAAAIDDGGGTTASDSPLARIAGVIAKVVDRINAKEETVKITDDVAIDNTSGGATADGGDIASAQAPKRRTLPPTPNAGDKIAATDQAQKKGRGKNLPETPARNPANQPSAANYQATGKRIGRTLPKTPTTNPSTQSSSSSSLAPPPPQHKGIE